MFARLPSELAHRLAELAGLLRAPKATVLAVLVQDADPDDPALLEHLADLIRAYEQGDTATAQLPRLRS